MTIWKKVLFGAFALAVLGAGVCAVARVNPLSIVACLQGSPGCPS